MIAAIYARKSTEQLGVGDEAKSVARQVEHARAYAERKGWSVAAAHVYEDDGISGAEFLRRPGLARLMNALAPRPPFQVLIMSEESRLGREQIETAYLVKQLTDAGVRLFFYLEDRERTLDTAMDKVMLSLANFAAEMEREKGSQRVFDAARQRAAAGKVAGAKIYGYDNVPMLSTELGRDGQPRRLYTERRLNEAQAAVVQRIFALYADGVGTTRIAQQLNAERVPAPRRQGWSQPGLKHMLRNEIYRGVTIWGRVQNTVRKGTKKHRARNPKDWIRRDAPELRVVDEALWERVEARRRQRRDAYPRVTGTGQLLGRPSWRDGHSDYLLPGFASCKVCGGSIRTVHERHGAASGPSRRVVVRKYGCATNQTRGDAACGNRTRLRQEILDRQVLQAIERLLDEEMVAWAADQVLERLRASHGTRQDRQGQLEDELAKVEHRIQRSLDLLLEGDGLEPELRSRLRDDRRRKDVILVELGTLNGLAGVAALDEARIRAELLARASAIRGVLNQHVVQARGMLRRLLKGEPVVMEPVVENGVKGYRFEGHLCFDALLTGEAFADSSRRPNRLRLIREFEVRVPPAPMAPRRGATSPVPGDEVAQRR